MDELLLPADGGTLDSLVASTAGNRHIATFRFSHRWAATPWTPAVSGSLLKLDSLVQAGVFAEAAERATAGGKTKYAVRTHSLVAFVHGHRTSHLSNVPSTEDTTHLVPSRVATFLHVVNLNLCHPGVGEASVTEYAAMVSVPGLRISDFGVVKKPTVAEPDVLPHAAVPQSGAEPATK